MKKIIPLALLYLLFAALAYATWDNPFGGPGGGANYQNVVAALGYTPAHNGANSDITSLTGLTTPLSIGQGGTGSGTAAGALLSLGGLPSTGVGLVEQIVAVFDGGGSIITTGQKPVYVHRDYALTSINKWTVQCNNGATDSTPIIVNVGGKVTSASTAGALPTIASNGFCGSGTPPTGGTTTPIIQAAWNCSTTSTAANTDFIFSVTQAPTASTWCSVIVEGIR